MFVKNFLGALDVLQKKGFNTALVGGGGKCDTSAMESGILDEIFLDVEPLVFGSGIPLFSPSNIDLKLELLDSKRIGASGIQLHYKVLK